MITIPRIKNLSRKIFIENENVILTLFQKTLSLNSLNLKKTFTFKTDYFLSNLIV